MEFQPQLPFARSPPPDQRPTAPRHVHDFRTSLAESAAWADAGWWMDLYRRAFPTLISAVSVRDDGWAQRGGIDRVLTLASGRVYTVDEKVRSRDWPDVLLEQWSDEDRRKPGWVQKPLAVDFICYGYAPSRRAYLLPVAPLQRAWRMHGRGWIASYGQRRALNPGYVSTSIPVPIDVLMRGIVDAMLVCGQGGQGGQERCSGWPQ